LVKCSRALEAIVDAIITYDGIKIDEVPYRILNIKLTRFLCIAIGVTTCGASLTDLYDDINFVIISIIHILVVCHIARSK
jgi:uncharacterized protein YegL